MARVITGPATNIPLHPKSHVRGWTLGWADLLEADIDEKCSESIKDYDEVYLDHGVNWGGSLNLFTGATDPVFERFDRLLSLEPENVTSLDWEMPDYGTFLMKRLNASSTSRNITAAWCERLTEFCKAVKHIDQVSPELGASWLTWGDSHATAYAPKGSATVKKDGRTLYGVIGNGSLDGIEVSDSIKGITLCLGSIDVRHHLNREGAMGVLDLVSAYVDKATKLRDRLNYSLTRSVRVELAAPVPIEFEGRKIPKTGYFKGTPFSGERGHRLQYTYMMINALKKSDFPVVAPPVRRYTMDGEEYAKEYMELGGSVHMAPPYYRRNDDEWVTLNGVQQ